jgi:UDP-glucose 4-epimerase
MKKFVVTGGCGFIGSHLVELLVSMGHSVIIIDDLSSGFRCNIENISGDIILIKNKVESFNFDSLDKIDCLFHLAAQASVPYSIDHFFTSSSCNMLGTFKVIEFCTNRNIPMVYATSSAVYGNLSYGIETEGIELLSPYATDKFSMEMYTAANFNLKGISSFGLRFFNVYGPRQDASSPYSGVISLFVDRLNRGEPITINGGYQTRDFVFVKDVVNCLYKAYNYLLVNNGAKISNVLTGKSISIDTLVINISKIMNVKPLCNYRELPAGDPESSMGSTLLMETLLNVKTADFVDIESGLKQTIAYLTKK